MCIYIITAKSQFTSVLQPTTSRDRESQFTSVLQPNSSSEPLSHSPGSDLQSTIPSHDNNIAGVIAGTLGFIFLISHILCITLVCVFYKKRKRQWQEQRPKSLSDPLLIQQQECVNPRVSVNMRVRDNILCI